MAGKSISYPLDVLRRVLEESVNQQGAYYVADLSVVEAPSQTGYDYGINLGAAASKLNEPVAAVTSKIAATLTAQPPDMVQGVVANGPFVNFKIDMARFGDLALRQVLEMGSHYGKETEGKGRKVVVDMSSPNIAKRMSYGHLRSTIIGDALANLYRSQGYEVVRDNHLGDWGTQFGKLIVAIKKWGDEKAVLGSDDPIGALQDLYVKFDHESTKEADVLREKAKDLAKEKGFESTPGFAEAIETISQEIMKRKSIKREDLEMDKVIEDALDRVIESDLQKEARAWFLRLEKGDPEARRLWRLCVDLSMKEFSQLYEVLGVNFEETLGESFYEDQLQDVVDIVKKSDASKVSEGALVIDMQDKGLGVAIVQKSDGASLYLTRDLACAIYRQNEMKADKAIYVVGEDQKQYFRQLFEALRRLGYKIGESAEHVYFGMVSLPEGKMSTRKGRVILLKDVVSEGLKKAASVLLAKNPELSKDKTSEAVVRQIAIGALKWNDLSQDAKKAIVFDWDKALNFEGNSAPYVQYTAVRANSILQTAQVSTKDLLDPKHTSSEVYGDPTERALVRQLSEFPNAINEALKQSSPAKIAGYVYELAKRFNSFYTHVRVLKAETEVLKESRLRLVAATSQTITNALGILGIEVPEKM
jgi:arginyl-tRNA synthetase